jgi:hypothetical protein
MRLSLYDKQHVLQLLLTPPGIPTPNRDMRVFMHQLVAVPSWGSHISVEATTSYSFVCENPYPRVMSQGGFWS